MDYKELLIGCGNKREKILVPQGESKDWKNLTTLDIDPLSKPDYLHDLNILPYPFEDNTFDEIHAYEVLEHTGIQGDYKFFFAQFSEFYRILKPNGHIFITTPGWNSMWTWGDPGHSRVISAASLVFLNQEEYKKQVGKTSMTDYRSIYKGNFKAVYLEQTDEYLHAVLMTEKT